MQRAQPDARVRSARHFDMLCVMDPLGEALEPWSYEPTFPRRSKEPKANDGAPKNSPSRPSMRLRTRGQRGGVALECGQCEGDGHEGSDYRRVKGQAPRKSNVGHIEAANACSCTVQC